MRTFSLIPLFCCLYVGLFAQNTPETQPKLIVGIVVDQMRYDLLYKFSANFGPNGFKRLLREGFSCENTHYDFVPTYTGPGHACVYTGTGPMLNGVIANEWWDRDLQKSRYVTSDPAYKTVGATGKVGQHSPAVLLSSTITDELRLATNFRSKVVGICLKDRGSILPAGHIPNAAYWFDDATGNWITSTYYPDSVGLPQWVQSFNTRKLPENYLSKPWDKLAGITYSASFKDWANFDDGQYAPLLLGGFPHDLPALRKKMGLGLLRFTPAGNTFTLDFALEAVDKMQLGTDADTDFLCLSFSATDYCGHQFGIHAEETEDIYIRLDAEIARLLSELDKKFGKDNVLVFLTADHGGAETPAYLEKIGIPAGVFPEDGVTDRLNVVLNEQMGSKGQKIVLATMNQQIWFNYDLLDTAEFDAESVLQFTASWLRDQPGVLDAYTIPDLQLLPADNPFAAQWRRGIYAGRSGEIMFQLKPGWHPDDKLFAKAGTTHGSSYPYDTHVPLVWYGGRVRPGVSYEPVAVSDIAPSLAAMLRIMEPNGSTGKIIQSLLNQR